MSDRTLESLDQAISILGARGADKERVKRYDAVRKAIASTLLQHQQVGLLRFMPREQTIDACTEAVLALTDR